MKKGVKIIVLIVAVIALVIYGIYSFTKATEVRTVSAQTQPMTEKVELKGNVFADGMEVITATKSGILGTLDYKVGDTVVAGTLVSEIDDSEYQEEIQDQIKVLEEQKKAAAAEGRSSLDQAKLQQVQLAGTADAARRQYYMMFQDGGTASNNVNAAEYALEAAKWNYEAAHDANKQTRQAWEENKKAGLVTGNATVPYSGSAMASLAYAYSEAKEQLENAKLMNSEQNKEYYQGLIESYENQYYALDAAMKNANAATSASVSVIDANIASLERKAQKAEMTCTKGGIIADVMVEAGTFVEQFTPIMAIYTNANGHVESYMLTEDAANFQVGEEVQVTLPDKTVVAGKIEKISSMAEEKVSTLGITENRCRVEISVPEMPKQYGPGYEVTLNFERILSEEAVILPVSAIATEDEETFVYLIDQGKAKKTPVSTGLYSGGMVQILTGIEEGSVVCEEAESVKDGMRVKTM